MHWFDAVLGALERWRSLRALRALDRRAGEGGQWKFKGQIDEALDVLERGNRIRAMEIWQRAYATFPAMAMQSDTALDFLIRAQRYDEAEALLTRGRQQYPGLAHPMEGLALVAYGRGDWAGAVQRCDVLRAKHPRSLKGYWIAAASLSELGRTEEAEAVLAIGLRVVPEDASLRIEHARLAERRQAWTEALHRWTEVHMTYGHLAGTAGAANALAELGRLDEAEQLLSGVIHKAGNELAVWVARARIAEHRQDWAESADRWETVRKRFPDVPLGYIQGIRALRELGRLAEAEQVLRECEDRIPDNPAAAIEFARSAVPPGDQTEAALG